MTARDLREADAQLVLGNTYHLYKHPGVEIVREFGGLAEFMGWKGPTITDSGGFQVFSLSDTRRISDEGVVFRSVYDGALIKFTPESVMQLQQSIGADFIVALDECPPYPCEYKDVKKACDVTYRWAKRFLDTWRKQDAELRGKQAPFLVIQGGVFDDLRRYACNEAAELNPWGFGIGGVSVGEPHHDMIRAARICCEELPETKPRHLLGVGMPQDIISAIEVGIDMFDCVLPTRNGRNGQAFTSKGKVNLRNKIWKKDHGALDELCNCMTCNTVTKAYLHHLIVSDELLGGQLLSQHNVHYYISLMREARDAITAGNYAVWRKNIESRWY